jgi:xylan 1,4-beta-xylosidase
MRFHGLFHEDMHVYRERADGSPVYNWQYMDDLVDAMLARGIRPCAELAPMPYALASDRSKSGGYWGGNYSAPRDFDRWGDLVRQFALHSINRYGLGEVRRWYFELWNEPMGHMRQEDYFRLYVHTARALKAIDDQLKVGGPASSDFQKGEAPWLRDFLAFCDRDHLPVDFVSVHPYPCVWPQGSDGRQRVVYRPEGALREDLTWLRRTIDASPFPRAETMLTEWNASANNNGELFLDTAFMAPFVVQNNIDAIGLVDSLGFWVFTDVFEEMGAPDAPFLGYFGMMTVQGIPKPSFNGYRLLARLGDERLGQGPGWFAARRGETVQVMLWNYSHFRPGYQNIPAVRPTIEEAVTFDRYSVFEDGAPRVFDLRLAGLAGTWRLLRHSCDRACGSAWDAWIANGAPLSPDQDELAILQAAARPSCRRSMIENRPDLQLTVEVPPHGVTLLEFTHQH